MTVNIRQVNAGTSPQKIGTAPPGSVVILSCTDTSADVFWDTVSAVTVGTGAALPSGGTPLVFSVPETAKTFDIYVVAATGTHVTTCTVISPG